MADGRTSASESSGVRYVSDTELLSKSKPDSVRRVEVFTGAGRRRTWTAEQKAQIVAESRDGGETVSAVARRHGLTPQQLFGWRRQTQQDEGCGPGQNATAFTPVVVEAAAPQPNVPLAAARLDGSPMIEIMLGAATVRVPTGIHAEPHASFSISHG
jgi:transposase-like protein